MGYWRFGAMCAPVVLASAAVHAGEITWHRSSDWVPGAQQGSTQNNPGPAAGGSFVWKYEWAQGGGPLGSANPWYAQPRQTMKWDGLWWQTGAGAWVRDDETSPPIMQDRLIHNLHTSTFDTTPVVTWTNPLDVAAEVSFGGSLTLRWSGKNGLGYAVDVDVLLAIEDGATGALTPLISQTFSKPTPGPSINDEVQIPVEFPSSVVFGAGDRLILTHRGRESFGPLGMWVTVLDDVQMTLVPAPGSFALIGLAGAVVARRRRR